MASVDTGAVYLYNAHREKPNFSVNTSATALPLLLKFHTEASTLLLTAKSLKQFLILFQMYQENNTARSTNRQMVIKNDKR